MNISNLRLISVFITLCRFAILQYPILSYIVWLLKYSLSITFLGLLDNLTTFSGISVFFKSYWEGQLQFNFKACYEFLNSRLVTWGTIADLWWTFQCPLVLTFFSSLRILKRKCSSLWDFISTFVMLPLVLLF
jgi:hypothetical protein